MDPFRRNSNSGPSPVPIYVTGLKTHQNPSVAGFPHVTSPSPGPNPVCTNPMEDLQNRMKLQGETMVSQAPPSVPQSTLSPTAFAFQLAGQAQLENLQRQHMQVQQQFAHYQSSPLAPMILTASPMADMRAMHIPESSFSYFHQPLVSAAIPRVDDFHRGGVLFPINTLFMSTEHKDCCLIDRGTRCNRPASTAGFTLRIKELVTRAGAPLMEDAIAGHQYICDFHKNYIQKLRLSYPQNHTSSPFIPPNILSGPSHSGIPSFYQAFSPANNLAPSLFVDQSQSNSAISSSKPDDLSTSGDNSENHLKTAPSPSHKSPPVINDNKGKEQHDPSSAPVDMRMNHVAENRPVPNTARTSPESVDEDSSEEEYEGGPATTDLLYGLVEIFTEDELLSYVKQFEIDVSSHPTRDELIRLVCEHMDTVSVPDPKSTLTELFHMVKNDRRAFDQRYKPPLNTDFDLSSDEEMLLVETKNGLLNGHVSSSDGEVPSDSDAEVDGDVTEEFPIVSFDSEMQRVLSEINGQTSVADIERLLEKYTIPLKSGLTNRDSDLESSSTEDQRTSKRDAIRTRKRKRINREI